jgi:hypothetical protein
MFKNSPLLALLEGIVSNGTTPTGHPAIDVARAVVNSPAVELLVSAQNNPLESLLLGFAKAILPLTPAAPSA